MRSNLLKNGIASLLQKVVRVAEQVFLIPFFITYWGVDYYGEWLTLTIIPSVIAFSDLGFGTAASNTFVLRYLAGDLVAASNINKTALYAISALIILGLLISTLTLFSLDYFSVFDGMLINANDAIISVSLMIFARILEFYSQLFEGYYRAARKAALAMSLLALKAFFCLIAGLLVILSGNGVVLFALSQLIVIIIFNIYFYLKGSSILGLNIEYGGNYDRIELKGIIKTGLGYLLSPIWQAIYFQGSTFAVRIVLGPAAVTVFNTVRTLSRSVNQIYNMANSAVFPELQFEIGKGNFDKAKRLYLESLILMLFTGVVGALFLGFFGLKLYSVWTKNLINISDNFWYVFVFGVLLNAIWWTSAVVFRALNKPYMLSFFGLASAITSVLMTYFLSTKWGLIGAAVGNLTLDVLMAVCVLPYASRLMGVNIKDVIAICRSYLKSLSINKGAKLE